MNRNTVGYISVIALLSITSFFSLNLFFQERECYDKLDISAFPYTVGEWKGEDLEVTEREYDILETRNLISRRYINPSNEKIFLFIIYSETNRAVFHPPEVCIIGSGGKIVDKKSESVDTDKYKFLANKLYVGKDRARNLVLYCYKAGNLYTDNFYLQQIYFAVSQLFRKHVGGATIRVSMPIGQNEKATLTKLKDFMKETIVEIEKL